MARQADKTIIVLVVFVITLLGCATSKQKTEPVDAFSKVVDTSLEIVKAELKFKPSVRRDEAIVSYINNGGDSDNINSENVNQSFANYVCVGSKSLSKPLVALEFVATYARTAKSISTPAGDSFAEQWARFNEEFKLKPIQESKDKDADLKVKCIAEVLDSVPPKGEVLTDASDESLVGGLITAYSSIEELINSLKKLGKGVLAVANEKQARTRLKSFVNANDEEVNKVLSNDLNPEIIKDAWERRKKRSLFRPYYLFTTMVETDMSPTKLLETASAIDIHLQEYDAIRTTKSPDKLLLGIAIAQEELKLAVNKDEFNSATLFAFFQTLLGDLETLKMDYEDVESKAKDARQAIRNL